MAMLKNRINHYCHLIEEQLNRFVPETSDSYNLLFEASRYTLLNGGKRLRPILTLATAELFKADPNLALAPACAVEMIHTYSMIHDDLPCMDDDDFRRGNPTLHKKYDEGFAVLAGDYLLTRAFEILADDNRLPETIRVQLIKQLAQASGGHGMIGGQIMDLQAEKTDPSLETLEMLHSKKTGALIVCAVRMGAIIGQASPIQFQLLESFALKMGLAFQVTDDILDVTAGEKKRGSLHSSDVANQKSTYVSLLGIEQAKQTAESLQQEALLSLKQLSLETSFLEALLQFVNQRTY
jgi:geranylgeranyl diphosphate synthase, type II